MAPSLTAPRSCYLPCADRNSGGIEAHWEAINRAVTDSTTALLPVLRGQERRWEDSGVVRAEQAFLEQRAASADVRGRHSRGAPL